MAPAMPETPAATAPVVAAEPEPTIEPEPVAAPEPLPDPATLLQSHDRLSLPDSFSAVLADEAMFLLANTPYRAPAGGGAGLAVASLALQAGALALYTAERSEAYRADHAEIVGYGGEEVTRVHPGVATRVVTPEGNYRGSSRAGAGRCSPARGECVVRHPDSPGLSQEVYTRVEDMPYLSNVMREGSEGVRTRGGVNLRYWSSGNREVPWLRYLRNASENASETWSGYGAWQEWSGFGLVMLSHNHQWDLYDGAYYYGITGGDLTGGAPEIAGTWRGAAVAMSSDLSTLVDGEVAMTVRLGVNPSLDINIGGWQGYRLNDGGEIGLPVSVSIDNVIASNIPIEANGKFYRSGWVFDGKVTDLNNPATNSGIGATGHGEISGAFYGPGGGEAAGRFITYIKDVNARYADGTTGFHGVFGVRKPDEPQ